MKPLLQLAMIAALLIPTVGCAGGWREGGPVTLATAASAPKAAAAAPGTPISPAKTTSATAEGVTFVYTGPAKSVNVAGEFNAWSTSADALAKQADGSWRLVKVLPAGRYAYKFVIDGSEWKADAGAPEGVDDGFGGKNSLVAVGTVPATAVPAAAAAPMAAGGTGATSTAEGTTFRYIGAATSVNLAGDFNAWSTSADALVKQADGTWAITKKLAAGRYAYKFVIDGGTWKEDPAAKETVDDGFGGKNAIMVVGASHDAAAATATATPSAAAATNPSRAVSGKAKAPQFTAAGVVFTFAGTANTVALSGDFNNWATNADFMKQGADGTWTLTKKLAAGSYGYKFLVNGNSWKTDEANPASKDDGFGGKNSLITIK